MRNQKNTQEEIEFRIEFRKEFGVDWIEAWDNLQKHKKDSERRWNDVLIKYGLVGF